MADTKMSLSTLTTKQKVIGVLTVVILGFVVYEIIGLFSGEKTPEATIKPTQAMVPTPAKEGPRPLQSTTQTTTTVMSQSNALTPVNAITPPKENNEMQKQQQEQQQNYLESVNQLQLLKVKREIAETNQAIASARLATETANKSMSDLLTQPTLPAAPPGADATFRAGLAAAVQSAQSTEEKNETPKPVVAEVPFNVVSVSMQSNHWSAILGYDNKLYSVATGDTLFDGSTVVSISKTGVTLLKDGKRRKIRIQTTI